MRFRVSKKKIKIFAQILNRVVNNKNGFIVNKLSLHPEYDR